MTVIGNSQVVDGLFRQHHGWLRSWLVRKTDTASADDVASEVFLRLLVLPYVGELREPRAMMTTIASRIINELRRRTGLLRVLEAEIAAEPAGLMPSPEEKLLLKEALRSIDAILADLCPKARAAFLLNRIDGMPQQEIARRLGVSTRTIERYLAHGMRLALQLQESA